MLSSRGGCLRRRVPGRSCRPGGLSGSTMPGVTTGSAGQHAGGADGVADVVASLSWRRRRPGAGFCRRCRPAARSAALPLSAGRSALRRGIVVRDVPSLSGAIRGPAGSNASPERTCPAARPREAAGHGDGAAVGRRLELASEARRLAASAGARRSTERQVRVPCPHYSRFRAVRCAPFATVAELGPAGSARSRVAASGNPGRVVAR